MSPHEKRLRAAIWALIDTFEGAIHQHDSKGKGGQHVTYTGDFGSLGMSAVTQMRRWVKDLRAALDDKWPVSREEWKVLFPNTSETDLDELFKDR